MDVRALLSGKRDPRELFYFGTLQPCVCFTVTRPHTLQDLSDADQLYEAREQARTEKMNRFDSIFFSFKINWSVFPLCYMCTCMWRSCLCMQICIPSHGKKPEKDVGCPAL